MSLKNFMSYEDASTVLGEYADKVNELKSGLTNVDVALSVPEGSGKNLLKVTASSTSGSGVTFTVNSDGTVSLNGTATNTVILTVGTFTFEANKSYVLSGCPANGSTSTYLLSVQGVGYDSGEGYIYTPTSDQDKNIVINIYSGTNVDGKVFSPMIRPAGTTPDFAPYIPSVESRIEAVESGLDDVNNNLTPVIGTVTYGSKTESSQTDVTRLIKSGKVVQLWLNAVSTNNMTAYENVAVKLPEGFRPGSVIYSQCLIESDLSVLKIATNGDVLVTENVTTGKHITALFSFITD